MPLTMGEWMKSRRIAAGLTQEQLAERLDVDQTWVGRIENGVRKMIFTPEEVRTITAALGTTPMDFFEALGYVEDSATADDTNGAVAIAKVVAQLEASPLPRATKDFINHAIRFSQQRMDSNEGH